MIFAGLGDWRLNFHSVWAKGDFCYRARNRLSAMILKRTHENDTMTAGQNEAFSRILIDRALEFSGWDLLNPQQVQFELHTSSGRADYLLKDKLGRVHQAGLRRYWRWKSRRRGG